jgi:hypothetical protein
MQKMFDLGFEAMEAGKLEGAIYLLSQFINSIDGLVKLPDRSVHTLFISLHYEIILMILRFREVSLAIDSLRLCLMSQWGTVVIVQPPKTQQNSQLALTFEESESTVEITELNEDE